MAFCPPTSLAARYAGLPPFDLSVGGDGGGGGGGGGGVGGGGGSVVFGSSPLTPTRLWDEHIQEISRELEVICGSPRNRAKERSVSSRPPPLTQHLSIGCLFKASPSASTLKCPAPPPGAIVAVAASRSQRLFRVESQDRVIVEPPLAGFGFCLGHEPAPPVFRHRLTVRHEETRSKLNRQLALVCPIKSDEIPPKRPSEKYCEHRHSDSHIVRRQMSSKSGVLYKVPIDQRKSEELFVSFLDDHVLRVCADDATKEDEESVVEEVSVPTEVPVQSLVLSVFDGRWLYIQQRTTEEAMVLDFVGTSTKYLPIIHENEARLQLEISLRIPSEFDPDEVTVKTIDDRVVVSGSKRPAFSVSLGGEDGGGGVGVGPFSPPLTVGHVWTPPSAVCFVVILPLPSGTQSRSVSAYFSRPHHLVITGRLYPTRRRYTL